MNFKKTIWKALSVVAAGAFVFMPVACEDYQEQYNPNKGEEEAPEVVKVEKTFASSLEKANLAAWEAGSGVNVYWGANAEDFAVAEASAAGATASFVGEVAEVDNYAAVYPTSVSAVFPEAGKVNVTIPAVQDGALSSTNVLAAVSSKEAMSFAFENVGAILKFTVEKDNVAQVVVSATEPLGGVVEMTIGATTSVAVSGNAKSVTFPTATVGNAVTPGDYYVCVAPVTLSEGITVSAVSTEGAVIAMNTIELEGVTALERGQQYDLGVADYVDPSSILEYFVTVAGNGSKSGLDWANAMSVDELRTMLTADEATEMNRGKALDGKTIHLAAGEYVLGTEALPYSPVSFAGYPTPVKVLFKGGYDPANLENCTPATTPTIFSGNETYAGFVFGDNVNFTFEGVNFEKAMAPADAELVKTVRGAASVISTTATLTFNDCIFKNNVETGAANDYAGGSALLVIKGKVYVDGCIFDTNKGGSRGSAVRVDDKSDVGGTLFLNDCVFTNNEITKDAYGMAIFSRNNIAMNKCIFVDNKCTNADKNNPSVNVNYNYIMTNCTFLEASFFSSGTGVIRSETENGKGYTAAMMNNIVVNTYADASNVAFGILASKAYNVSKGYNVFCAKDKPISHTDRLPAADTDTQLTAMTATYAFNPATYELTWTGLSFNFADNAAVKAMLLGEDMIPTKGNLTYAADVAAWLETIGAL